MPLIVKLIPINLPHQYKYLPLKNNDIKNFIDIYIESPGYALFYKEAWMYCFCKSYLLQYTPTFTCVSNCYIINGFPITNLTDLKIIYNNYAESRTKQNKNIPYKKWFNILIDKKSDQLTIDQVLKSNFGCFEMKEIDGTIDDIIKIPGSLNLSIIFEYLYTKVIAAFIGRVIFTDDHFGNIAYISVDYTRSYTIKCNGCKYNFYMPPGKMIQFIDLERYVFNYSRYDIYTNDALKNINDSNFIKNIHMDIVRKSYNQNNYIFDKSMTSFQNIITKENFETSDEYIVMLKIITSNFVHDIKTFCQIMDTYLPKKYLVKPDNDNIYEYYIDLDNDLLRVINYDDVNK
jgi:hypothetical protein